MHDIEHLPGIFTLGYLGETNFRTIEIDMNAWLGEIPNGIASVIHIRPGESADQAYMAATTFENGILRWPITALDLGNYDGYGTMQISLHGMDDGNHQIGKSENVRTRVNDSATSMSGDIPDAQQSWMDRMAELIDEQRIQKDKIDILVDGIDRFPVVTYVECRSWENMLAMWSLASSGQVIPGVTTHDGRSYGLSLAKPDGYEPRENDLLMVRMTADLKTPYQLTKYYICFSNDTETYDPVTGRTYITTGNESYPIDNMNLHYDSDITLFEKGRVYVFRYHTKQVGNETKHVYDVLNYTPGLKEAAELAETALAEAQTIIDGNVVRYDRPQSLTYEQKSQFRDNIGAAELLGGKVPASQLPSYVDDVLEYASRSAFPETGEAGKIYVALDTNLTYRWTGSTYVEISQSLALGETAQTAFPGDRGLAVETEVENRAKVLYAECTEIVTNPAGFRRICVNVPNGYSPKSGDYLAVKFPATNEIANPPHRYALHYNFHGAVITEDVTVMNLAQDKFDAGTVVFEADSIYLFRHIDEDECQIVGHRVGQALGDTAGTAFPGERGKAVEDSLAEVNKNVYATVTDVQTVPGGFVINCETDEECTLQAGDILYVKYTDDVQTVNATNQYMIRLSDQNGSVYFSAAIGNIGATEYSVGITVFENGHTYAYYYNGTNLQVVGLDAVNLGDTAGMAFPGERGKAVEDAINTKANATDVEALIKVQDTQPVESANKAWIKETPDEEIQVPTVAEMEAGLADKINKPAVDGTAGQILRTDGNGNTTWENPATAEEISSATETWLEDNITNPSNPPLDRSLSLSTAAAPADMVGDLKSRIKRTDSELLGLIGEGSQTVSGSWNTITIIDNLTLHKVQKYIVKAYLSEMSSVAGYLRIRKSDNSDIIAESLLNKKEAQIVYVPSIDLTGAKVTIGFASGTHNCSVEIYEVYDSEISMTKLELGQTTLTSKLIRNGVIFDTGNANYVSTPVIFTNADAIKVITDRPNSTNCIYRYYFATAVGDVFDLAADDTKRQKTETKDGDPTYMLYATGRRGVQISLAEYNTSANTLSPLRIGDFEGYKISIIDTTFDTMADDLPTIRSNIMQAQFDISALQTGLSTETTNRETRDGQIQTELNNEKTAREQGDISLKSDYEAAITSAVAPLEEQVEDVNASLGAIAEGILERVPKPATSPNGTAGQLLRSIGNGGTEWTNAGLPTDEQTHSAVAAWLASHPEATTTVQDGSITEAKLAAALKGKIPLFCLNFVYDSSAAASDNTALLEDAIESNPDGMTILFDSTKLLYLNTVHVTGNNLYFIGGRIRGTFVLGDGEADTFLDTNNVHFENVCFENDDYTRDAIVANTVNMLVVDGCRFDGCRTCVKTDPDASSQQILRRGVITNNYMIGLYHAIDLDINDDERYSCGDLEISTNLMYIQYANENYPNLEATEMQAGYSIYGKRCDGIKIEGNTLFTSGIYLDSPLWSHISDNNIFNTYARGIYVKDAGNTIITGNNIGWIGYVFQTLGQGIFIDGTYETRNNNIISGNIFHICMGAGLKLSGASNVIVSGNLFDECGGVNGYGYVGENYEYNYEANIVIGTNCNGNRFEGNKYRSNSVAVSALNYINDETQIGPNFFNDAIHDSLDDLAVFNGKRNLININQSTEEVSGITFTMNDDGSITINGTASANITKYISTDFSMFEAEKKYRYWLRRSPEANAVALTISYKISGGNWVVPTQWNSRDYTFEFPGGATNFQFGIMIASGRSFSNVKVYPMIAPGYVNTYLYSAT